MFRIGDLVQSKLKNTPVVQGVIQGHQKIGSTNRWDVRLINGENRSFTSKGIAKRPRVDQEDGAPAALVPRIDPVDARHLIDDIPEDSDAGSEDEAESVNSNEK